jgi:hypothetical protein
METKTEKAATGSSGGILRKGAMAVKLVHQYLGLLK